jgi:hypothetical protein
MALAGPGVTAHVEEAREVLEVGCGIGVGPVDIARE